MHIYYQSEKLIVFRTFFLECCLVFCLFYFEVFIVIGGTLFILVMNRINIYDRNAEYNTFSIKTEVQVPVQICSTAENRCPLNSLIQCIKMIYAQQQMKRFFEQKVHGPNRPSEKQFQRINSFTLSYDDTIYVALIKRFLRF